MTAESLSPEELAAYAHEIRGALTIVAGYTELLSRPLPDDEREEALQGIERAINRANALCADATAGRSPRAGHGRSVTAVSLGRLAEQVAADQRPTSGRRIDVDAATDGWVLGDAEALSRAVGNLVENAAKYSPAETPIEIAVGEGADADGIRHATISVSDRGPGIPAEERERVVEPFVRLERDADSPGTGLGLAIAHDVVVAQGGRLELMERPGGGTVARITLAAAQAAGE